MAATTQYNSANSEQAYPVLSDSFIFKFMHY